MALDTSLLAYYSLEDTAGTDATARGNDLSTTSGTPANAAGKQGNALSVAGAAAIRRADTADLSIGARDFEICGWINPSGVIGTKRFWGKDLGSGTREYVLRTNGTKVECFAWSGAVLSTVLQHGATISTSTWYFVDWYFTSATKTMGLLINDASAVTTILSTTAIDDGTAQFAIGATYNGSVLVEAFSGLIDEVGVWGRNLSGAERTELYNAGAGRDYAYVSTAGAAGHAKGKVNTQPLSSKLRGLVS